MLTLDRVVVRRGGASTLALVLGNDDDESAAATVISQCRESHAKHNVTRGNMRIRWRARENLFFGARACTNDCCDNHAYLPYEVLREFDVNALPTTERKRKREKEKEWEDIVVHSVLSLSGVERHPRRNATRDSREAVETVAVEEEKKIHYPRILLGRCKNLCLETTRRERQKNHKRKGEKWHGK